MTEQIKKYFQKLVHLSSDEVLLIDDFFEPKMLKKKEFLLEYGKPCQFVAFINEGSIRHFHFRDGEQVTCDISFENSFLTEFVSFNTGSSSQVSFQALEDTQLLVVSKKRLLELYKQCPVFEQLGRKIAEMVATRSTKIAMSLASKKPELRYQNLLDESPEIFQRVPQKYIANLLGITPESLSRIRKRIYQAGKS